MTVESDWLEKRLKGWQSIAIFAVFGVVAKVLEKRGERIIRVQVVLITASGPLGEKPLVL